MDNFIKSILSRVLSEEIGNQNRWAADEFAKFGTPIVSRKDNIERIIQFMKENDIEIRPDFF